MWQRRESITVQKNKNTTLSKSPYLRSGILALATLTAGGVSSLVEANSTPSPEEFRTIDGSNNNLDWPSEGKAGILLRRNLDAHYDWVIRGENDLQNPRNISNILSNSSNPPKDAQTNLLETFFGQFVNHDKEETRASNFDFYSIPLPPGDFLTRPNSLNALLVGKGDLVQNAGGNDLINYATGWLDLSTVYGSSDDVMNGLRVGSDGKLRTSSYNVGTFTFSNELCSAEDCPTLPRDPTFTGTDLDAVVVAGDVRVGENVALTINHTLFHREHNRLATELKQASWTQNWDDEQLFQEARKLNIAQYQRIIFQEYLPVVLRGVRIPGYSGYKKNTESDTSIEFATGAFRYGHSTTAPYKLLSENLCPYTFTVPAGVFGPFSFSSDELPFAGQLGGPFTPSTAYALAGGPSRIVRGLIHTPADRVDLKINNVLRNIRAVGLIGNGVDLLVSDIVRGRETGMPSYDDLRRKFYKGSRQKNVYDAAGCVNGNAIDPLACFLEITADVSAAQNLQNIYQKVTDIDGVVGLLAEDKENSSDYIPRTAARIILDEYLRSRDGDRFWYEQPGYLTAEEQQLIEGRTFRTIVQDNFFAPDEDLPDNIFNLPNPLPSCSL